MKILFLARHFSYLRLFESAIAELAERGHVIHLSADREESLGRRGDGRAAGGALPEGDRRVDAQPAVGRVGRPRPKAAAWASTTCAFSILATTRRPGSGAARRSERRTPSAGSRGCPSSEARGDARAGLGAAAVRAGGAAKP